MADIFVNPGDAGAAQSNIIALQEEVMKGMIDLLNRLLRKDREEALPQQTFDEYDNQKIAATAVYMVESYGVDPGDGTLKFESESYAIEKVPGNDLGDFYFITDRDGNDLYSFQVTQEQVKELAASVELEVIAQTAAELATTEVGQAVPQVAEALIGKFAPISLPDSVEEIFWDDEKPIEFVEDEPEVVAYFEPVSISSGQTLTNTSPVEIKPEISPLERIAFVAETLAESQPEVPIKLETEQLTHRYKAEEYSIEANGDRYSIKDLDNQEIFSFEKKGDGYVILTDKMTTEQKQDFLQAYDEINRAGGIEQIKQQPLDRQIESLGNLSPSGARAIAFADQLLDGTGQASFQGQSYRFDRERDGKLSIKNEHGIEIVKRDAKGNINAQLSRQDTEKFKQLYSSEQFKSLQQSSRQPVAAAKRSLER